MGIKGQPLHLALTDPTGEPQAEFQPPQDGAGLGGAVAHVKISPHWAPQCSDTRLTFEKMKLGVEKATPAEAALSTLRHLNTCNVACKSPRPNDHRPHGSSVPVWGRDRTQAEKHLHTLHRSDEREGHRCSGAGQVDAHTVWRARRARGVLAAASCSQGPAAFHGTVLITPLHGVFQRTLTRGHTRSPGVALVKLWGEGLDRPQHEHHGELHSQVCTGGTRGQGQCGQMETRQPPCRRHPGTCGTWPQGGREVGRGHPFPGMLSVPRTPAP
ncbi:uncharacterized protein [Symphalangus syndactylus]|uniref:uncharacterized protein n=1 Tax=Symphalangus syndactylus TaxID=9590 RepID=UPI003006D8E0